VKYRAKNLTPKGFPPLPSPLLKGEGKGIMFLAGRGVRIKASLLLLREVFQRGQSVPHPIEKGYITVAKRRETESFIKSH
jgi:hypothetical protein